MVAASLPGHAATITGKVVKITDGDTVNILDATNTKHRIRLAGIDAPERKQPFGKASTRHLVKNAALQVVTVEYDKRDKYGRIVGKTLLGGMDLCLEQVRGGYAWHYKKYQRDRSPADRLKYAQHQEKEVEKLHTRIDLPYPLSYTRFGGVSQSSGTRNPCLACGQ